MTDMRLRPSSTNIRDFVTAAYAPPDRAISGRTGAPASDESGLVESTISSYDTCRTLVWDIALSVRVFDFDDRRGAKTAFIAVYQPTKLGPNSSPIQTVGDFRSDSTRVCDFDEDSRTVASRRNYTRFGITRVDEATPAGINYVPCNLEPNITL